MTIIDVDKPEHQISINSPMGSAELKGCHAVQNIGAVETYQRRYLWVAALEIVEHDALDASPGKAEAKPIAADFRSSPTMGALASLPPSRQALVTSVAEAVKERFAASDEIGAYEEACGITDSEEKTALWSLLDSKVRASIKKQTALERERQTA